MRHLMLAFMILLLPLRGWAGDMMATGMAAGQLTGLHAEQRHPARIATETGATNAHGTGAPAQFHAKKADHHASGGLQAVAKASSTHDCADMQAAAPDGHHGVESSSPMDCGVCPSCQACHTVALTLKSEKTASVFNPLAQPQAAVQTFASADAALSQKPPIS